MNGVHETIIFMGLRASGKSTIGRRLASLTKRTFIDLDEYTADALDADNAGVAIRTLGLDRFRSAEAESLIKVLDDPPGVLSLGGGTPTAPGAEFTLRRASSAGASIIYLHAPPTVLIDRLEQDHADRPSLTDRSIADEVQLLYDQRDSLYRALATRIVQVGGRPPEQIAAVLAALESN